MLRVLQFLAVIGMLLATATLGFAFLGVRELFTRDYFSPPIEMVLHRVEGPGIWFGSAAILYVLAGMARARRAESKRLARDAQLPLTGSLRVDVASPPREVATRG